MKRAILGLAIVVGVACGGGGGGGGGGGNPGAPPMPAVQIGGNWQGGTLIITGAEGTTCFAQRIRAAIGTPYGTNITVTQAGSNVTIEIFVDEDVPGDERLFLESDIFEGTIDAGGQIVAARVDTVEGSFITECDGLSDIDPDEGELTGTAAGSSMDLRIRQEGQAWPRGFGDNAEDWVSIQEITIDR